MLSRIRRWCKNQRITIKAAIIGGLFTIAGAFIAGLFSLMQSKVPVLDQNVQLMVFSELQATVEAISSHQRKLELQLAGITEKSAIVSSATVEALLNQQATLQAERDSLLATLEAMQTPIATPSKQPPVEIYLEASSSNSTEWRNRVVLSDLSEIVKFKLNVKNLTDIPSTSTIVKAELPTGLAFVPDSIAVIVSHPVPSVGSPLTVDITDESSLFESGLNIGILGPWRQANFTEVVFQAQLDRCPMLEYLLVGALAQINGSDWTVSQAAVDIANLACQPPVFTKEVSNTEHPGWADSVEASIGDLVEFHLTVSNPNAVRMDEIRVRDMVPYGLELYPGRVPGMVRIVFRGQTMAPHSSDSLFDSDGYLLGALEETGDFFEISYLATVASCPESGYSISAPAVVTSLQTEQVMTSATVEVRNCED